jgi:very-short-patch-repair endonuclease
VSLQKGDGNMAEDKDAVYRDQVTKVMVMIARHLRQRETTAERILWQALRNRQLGDLKFRRQHPVGTTAYVVDFMCYERKLVVELDGEIHHLQQQEDAIRQLKHWAIGSFGLRIMKYGTIWKSCCSAS